MAKALLQSYLGMESKEGTVDASAEELQVAYMEVMDASRLADDVEDDIEEMEEIEDGLEAIANDLEATLENGGVDTVAAAFAHQAVQGYVGRAGLESSAIMPGLESFGGDTGREASTQVSIESIKETISKIWNAIKAAVQKAIKAVRDFFAKIFGGVKKVESNLEQALKDIKEMKEQELKDDAEITVPYGESLKYDGKLDEKSVAKGVKFLKDLSKKAMGELTDGAQKMVTGTLDAIKAAKAAKSDEALDATLNDLTSLSKKVNDSWTKLANEVVSGDKSLVTETNSDGTGSISFEAAKGSKALDSKEAKQKPFSLNTLETIVKDSMEIIKEVDKEKDSIEKINRAREDAVKAGDDAVKDADKNAAYNVWEKAKSRVILRQVSKDAVKPVRQISAHGFSVARSAIALVDVHKGVYKDKKKD